MVTCSGGIGFVIRSRARTTAHPRRPGQGPQLRSGRGSGPLSGEETRTLLASIAPRVRDMPVRVATGERVLRPNMDAINPRWGPTLVRAEPDAADRALIDTAHHFIRGGITDLVVGSGDHAFASMAALARLHVVSHADHLSKSLQIAATTVSYLPATPAQTGTGVAS